MLYSIIGDKMNIQKTNNIINAIPNNVKLIAVTKNQSIDDVRLLVDLGVNDFGENKLQELIKKKELFPTSNWHFIGRIQTNKLRDIVKHSTLIHSVSELRYLEKINLEAQKIEKIQNVLLQLNIAGEETKKGLSTDEFNYIIANQHLFPNVTIKGLMIMGNNVNDDDIIKGTFTQGRELFEAINKTYPHFDTLSMGMSGDYQQAIECGSTMLRIGSLLFED